MAQDALFQKYRRLLIGQKLSAVWRGHGSTLFLEFGALSPIVKRDGSAGHARGAYSIMIDWSWRIELGNAIVCGSWSEDQHWEAHFSALIGRTVEDISLFGRLPELYVSLSGDFHVASFMTAEGGPEWTIFGSEGDDRQSRWLTVENGAVCESRN